MIGTTGTPYFESLLATLRENIPLEGYQLSVYCRESGAESYPCCTFHDRLCGDSFTSHLPRIFDQVATDGKPVVFRCPVGLLGFAVGLGHSAGRLCFLLGTGVREQSLDLFGIENLAKSGGTNLIELLEQLQMLPVVSEQVVRNIAERVHALASARLGATAPAAADHRTMDRLKLVATISSNLDQAASPREIFSLLQETIGIMFDVPSIVAAIPDHSTGEYVIAGGWGRNDTSDINRHQLSRFFPHNTQRRILLREDALRELFPRTQARFATCQSLGNGAELFGIVCYFGKEFSAEEFLLVELLTGRATQRLLLLRQEAEFARKSDLAGRFLSMIGTLSGIEGQDLYDQILRMASELADASCGSLMILDEEQELLQIRSSIGLSPQVTKAMRIRLGSGIAGKVAVSGHPLLVNDIEKDERVATPNRPRFRTKSFISLPLVTRVRVSGVLNLSDKRDQGIFTDADLELLTPFVSHIATMMQKNLVLEQVAMLERLSITDPLTELYNRRYLERRMEEEINRSMRNGSTLTILMIDLDYFKVYNDLYGHVAGDRALEKVARVLCASVRDMDVVTRYGGEEFCVLLPGAAKREAVYVANRVRQDIESELFHGEEHLPGGRLTTSIGISSFPGDGITATAVINAADIALYQAKSAGRNRIMIYNGGRTDTQGCKSTHLLQLS